MLAALTACGGQKQPAATYNDAGTYTLDSLDRRSGSVTGAELYACAREVTLELTEGGTGILTTGEDLVILSWRDGFITDETGTHAYTRENGQLTLDMSEGAEILVMTFVEGAVDYAALLPAEPSEPAPDEPSEPGEDSPVGTYRITYMDAGGESISGEELALMESLGLTVRLELYEDGTGYLVVFGEETELRWNDTYLLVEGEPAEYTYDGRTLNILSDGEAIMTFEKIDASSASAAGQAGRDAQGSDTSASRESDFTQVTGTLGENGEYEVSILGAEGVTDMLDEDAVRFYYSFTNNSDTAECAFLSLLFDAEEDGSVLSETFVVTDIILEEFGNDTLNIQPGVTILCVVEYSYQPDGSEMILRISDYQDNEVTAVFDPGALPGRPAAIPIEPIEDPQFYLDYPASGAEENYSLSIDGAEVAEGFEWGSSEQVLRVFLTYGNTSDAPSSCMWDAYLIAYQDGIQLPYGYPAEEADTDALYEEDIEPGETVTCSRCWGLRSDSPVEVVAIDSIGDVLCAATISLTE